MQWKNKNNDFKQSFIPFKVTWLGWMDEGESRMMEYIIVCDEMIMVVTYDGETNEITNKVNRTKMNGQIYVEVFWKNLEKMITL